MLRCYCSTTSTVDPFTRQEQCLCGAKFKTKVTHGFFVFLCVLFSIIFYINRTILFFVDFVKQATSTLLVARKKCFSVQHCTFVYNKKLLVMAASAPADFCIDNWTTYKKEEMILPALSITCNQFPCVFCKVDATPGFCSGFIARLDGRMMVLRQRENCFLRNRSTTSYVIPDNFSPGTQLLRFRFVCHRYVCVTEKYSTFDNLCVIYQNNTVKTITTVIMLPNYT